MAEKVPRNHKIYFFSQVPLSCFDLSCLEVRSDLCKMKKRGKHENALSFIEQTADLCNASKTKQWPELNAQCACGFEKCLSLLLLFFIKWHFLSFSCCCCCCFHSSLVMNPLLRSFHRKISRIDVHPKRSSLVSGSALTGSGRLRRQLASSLIEGSASLPPTGDKTDGQPAGGKKTRTADSPPLQCCRKFRDDCAQYST